MTKAREICIKRRNTKRMSIFTIIIQYCLAVLANASRQGKEKKRYKYWRESIFICR